MLELSDEVAGLMEFCDDGVADFLELTVDVAGCLVEINVGVADFLEMDDGAAALLQVADLLLFGNEAVDLVMLVEFCCDDGAGFLVFNDAAADLLAFGDGVDVAWV